MLQELIDRQRSLGLSDRLFGERIGMIEGCWRATRTGRRRLQPKVVRRIREVFPDLDESVTRFMREWVAEKTGEKMETKGIFFDAGDHVGVKDSQVDKTAIGGNYPLGIVVKGEIRGA